MARYRLSNVTVEFDLAAAGATPVPVPTPTPTPTPTPDPVPIPDPDDDPIPVPDPPSGGGTEPPPSAVVYRYREPGPLKFYAELERDEQGRIKVGYTGDRSQDGSTDEVWMADAFGNGKVTETSIGNLRKAIEAAGAGDVIKIRGGGGIIPGGEWRVSEPWLTVDLEQGAVYEFQPGNLPGAKGLPLGIGAVDSGFRLVGNGAHIKNAILPVSGADHNGAGIRQTRCGYTLVENVNYWDCQNGFLGDGTYKGVICQRVELDGVAYRNSGTQHGKEHHVYIQKTCRQLLARNCYFGAVKEGHHIQYRGWEAYLKDCTWDDEGSTASYLGNFPNGVVGLIEGGTAHLRPGRSQNKAFAIGHVADAVDRQPEVGLTIRNLALYDHNSKVDGVIRLHTWIKPEWVKVENSPLVQAA